MPYLQSDVVAEADGGEGDEAVVERVEVGPAFVPREHGGARSDDGGRQQARGDQEVDLGRVLAGAAHQTLSLADDLKKNEMRQINPKCTCATEKGNANTFTSLGAFAMQSNICVASASICRRGRKGP